MNCLFKNLGNTCYLNVTLHVFLSLKSFKNLLDNYSGNDILLLFLKNCKNCNNSSIDHIHDTRDVYNLYINRYNLKHYCPEDMVECVIHFIEYMSDRLLKYNDLHYDNDISNEENNINEISSVMKECACFDKYMSIISYINTIFTGIYSSSIIYSCCNKESHSLNEFQVIPFYISSSNSIHDCILNFISNEIIDGVYCDTCKIKTCINKTCSFHRFPKVLMFDIVSKSTSSTTTIKIDHDFIIDHLHVKKVYKYILQCIVVYDHYHYTCLVRHEDNLEFRMYNDHHTPISVDMTNITIPQARLLVYERIII